MFAQNSFKVVPLLRHMIKLRDLSSKGRTGLWMLLCSLVVFISIATRLALAVRASADLDFSLLNILNVVLLGTLYDFLTAIYCSVPFVLYLWLAPSRSFLGKRQRFVLYAWFFVYSFLLIFNAIAEWFFWDEFSGRFNFIAVDYLIYTTEVIGNIRQSYPVELIIAGVVALSTIIVILIRPALNNRVDEAVTFKKRSIRLGYYIALFAISLVAVNSKYHQFSSNVFVNELSGNGLYELFAAYRNNELDYDRFYRRMSDSQAFHINREQIKTQEASFTSKDDADITRNIVHTGEEKKLHVVMISVESFSADFMALFGNTEGITPALDSLTSRALVFTNLYATGTRTVRGLEALSLCVPPTPGQSIVRRPENEGMFSLGQVFHDKGYACEYIYGGYSYFDNMGYFFGHNGYDVVDRSAIKDEEIDYENIWGVADEDLFDLALKQIDEKSDKQPVFAHIMTTSNHRPFTYPDGRINIPSHTGRSGAVKYTDYSIGRFLKAASKKKWFDQTVFVIVADHCASSAGKTELPVSKYHIPMLIYSPANVKPGVMSRLMSQIDIGPTLLGMLNFSYSSKFYGYDMNTLEVGRERAFISTYQTLGYIRHGELIILSPHARVDSYMLTDQMERKERVTDQNTVDEAIASYQTASYAFKHGLMKN